MVRGKFDRQKQSRLLVLDSNRLVEWFGREVNADYVTATPWIASFVIFVIAPLMALRIAGIYYFGVESHWGGLHPYEYAYQYTLRPGGFDLSLGWELPRELTPPWPQYDRGVPGWYRQGIAEVAEHRKFIESLNRGVDTGIILAAAIANQGNSPQRPLGWEGLERIQVWFGDHVQWPFPEWETARGYWNAWFQQYSVGIGQITPFEVERLGYKLSEIDLFDDRTSIELMHAKMALTYEKAIRLGLNRSDALILMMVSNNNMFDTVENFRQLDSNIHRFLAQSPYAQRQLTRMMTYINYLHTRAGWPLPAGVDWDYLCRLARTSWAERM
jgi:hypothetical protein